MQQRYVVPEAQATRLATMIQGGVPLVRDPFGALGEALELTRTQVIDQLRAWHEDGLLREISAILEGSALGHDSALVAGRVAPERLDEVAAIVNEHPTVTHNYLRENAYNIWFTFIAPSREEIEANLARIARETGITDILNLPATRVYKIKAKFKI